VIKSSSWDEQEQVTSVWGWGYRVLLGQTEGRCYWEGIGASRRILI